MRITRRVFLRMVAGANVALAGSRYGVARFVAASPADPEAQAAPVSILIGDATPAECLRQSVWSPFAAESGVPVIDAVGAEAAAIAAAVEAGSVAWDVCEARANLLSAGLTAGWFEPVPWAQLTNGSDLLSEVRGSPFSPHAVGIFWYSAVLAYNTNAFPDPIRAPRSWADFWNVSRFPGPRALSVSPEHQLEIALMGDGVPFDRLYPLDLPRAFASLDRITPHVAAFYESGAQQQELLSSGAVAMSSAWNGQMFAAQREGQPVAFTFNQGVLSPGYYSVLRGGPNTADAWRVIDAMLDPEGQASFAQCGGYGPTNLKALDHLEPLFAAQLPNAEANASVQAIQNLALWIQDAALINEQYSAWKAGAPGGSE